MTHSEILLPRVIFFQVQDNSKKIQKIIEMSHLHFERQEPFLILVEDAKAQVFIDELLWKTPDTSFIPHTATDEESNELIAITKVKKNINQASFVFNLCITPLLIHGPFKIIYEFEDLTTPSKKNLSTLRFDSYKKEGIHIESH